jgi:hypothetical protein
MKGEKFEPLKALVRKNSALRAHVSYESR